jgi:hypothetical protein
LSLGVNALQIRRGCLYRTTWAITQVLSCPEYIQNACISDFTLGCNLGAPKTTPFERWAEHEHQPHALEVGVHFIQKKNWLIRFLVSKINTWYLPEK